MAAKQNLRQEDLQRLMQAIQRLYEHADLESFPHRVVEAIDGLIPADSTAYAEFGPDRAPGVRRPAAPINDRYLPGLLRHMEEHPVIEHCLRRGLPPAMAVSDALSRAEWDRRAVNREFYHKVGLRDQLNLFVPAPPGWMRSVAFGRTRFGFDSCERELVEQLRPHLIRAYENAETVAALQQHVSDPALRAAGLEPPVVRLSSDGRVTYVSEEARTLQRLYFNGTLEEGVPELVRNWCSANLSGRQRIGQVPSPRHPLTVRGPFGVLVLRLLSDPEHGGWRVVMRERPDHGVTEQRVEALPPRRRQVLTLMLRGYGEKQIGTRLGLSHHTVHSYIKLIYKHLGVRSREELLAAFIR